MTFCKYKILKAVIKPMICSHTQTVCISICRKRDRMFHNYTFDPATKTNCKSAKTQLCRRNVKRFGLLQSQADTQMLKTRQTYSVLLLRALLSGPSAVLCHSAHFMLFSKDIFPQISHAHVPIDRSHTCRQHTS